MRIGPPLNPGSNCRRGLLGALLAGCGWALALGQTPASSPKPPAPRVEAAPTTRPITLTLSDTEPDRKEVAASLAQWGLAPPLSIYESRLLLRQAILELESAGADRPVSRESAIKVEHILRAVATYIQQVDNSHPTYPYYTWSEVAAEKISPEAWKTFHLKLRRPVPNVTALALSVHNGDIEIANLTVTDVNRTRWEFSQRIPVPADQPRPEVCYLNLPTAVAEIQLSYAVKEPRAETWPRLFIALGFCSISESGKQARYYLQLARDDVRNLRYKSAAGNMRQAFQMLDEFQKSRRL